MNKLKQIREACIKANPEIVELKFGCEVKIPTRKFYDWVFIEELQRTKDRFKFTALKGEGRSNAFSEINKDEFEIIGRPIRLTDVLLAMDNRKFYRFAKTMDEANELAWDYWNLKDDNLNNQSPETLDFIHNLLCHE